MKKVFIDGRAGTTGLEIDRRMEGRRDIQLLTLPESCRKDPHRRQEIMNQADIVFLCLPDDAAREAVALIDNPAVAVIDTSTAHRTAPDWVYGFPELSLTHRKNIGLSKRVANPGCHASGFISIVYPLVAMGCLSRDAYISCFSLTGYTGGGKAMIGAYEEKERTELMSSPGMYALGQSHKHLAEMQHICGLTHAPVFCPIVDDYPRGMATTVSLHIEQLNGISGMKSLTERLKEYYADQKLVRVGDEKLYGGKLYANALAGRDCLWLLPQGNNRQITITALFDNLGKGASGAAVQNMNLILGMDEYTGLII